MFALQEFYVNEVSYCGIIFIHGNQYLLIIICWFVCM